MAGLDFEVFRWQMNEYWRDADGRAQALRDAYFVLDRLDKLYRNFDPEEQAMADLVVSQWLLSDNDRLWYDGLYLTRQFRISSALPAMRTLSERLQNSRVDAHRFFVPAIRKLISEFDGGARARQADRRGGASPYAVALPARPVARS
jgi:hypothetical protein